MNSSQFCKILDLQTIQKIVLVRFIQLFEDKKKSMFFKQKILETMFGLTILEDSEIINVTLTQLFHQYISYKSKTLKLAVMFAVRDNIKLVSPIHVLENAYVGQMDSIYNDCSIDQKLQMVAIIKLLIQNLEYLFHNTQFLMFLKNKMLSDDSYIVRMNMLKLLIEMKDFIGLKVFEKRILGILVELGNSSSPQLAQLFCHFVVVF